MSKEAMKLALEALESCGAGHITDGGNQWHDEKLVDKAIKALEEALAKQEQGEPVGAVDKDEFGLVGVVDASKVQVGDKLYTTPQQRTWVGLTDREKAVIVKMLWKNNFFVALEAVEAKLKEKNGIAPKQRTWVDLTDKDMDEAMEYWSDSSRSAYGGAYAADGEYVNMVST